MATTFWPALIGYALGSAQILVIDWIRARTTHRRQLRLLRAELRRLSGFARKYNWEHGKVPADDTLPNPPTITAGYLRLVQEVDFWLTDVHNDDNTQQGLLDIADGVGVLNRYAESFNHLMKETKEAPAPEIKKKLLGRAVATTQIYDTELDRWLTMVGSAVIDVRRRIYEASTMRQIFRSFKPMREGHNPPALPPMTYKPTD